MKLTEKTGEGKIERERRKEVWRYVEYKPE